MPRKTKALQYYEAIGRRREAIARVRLYIMGKEKVVTVQSQKIRQGEITINKRPAETMFSAAYEKERYLQPLKLTNNLDRFAISITVRGGGHTGQLEAIIHGLARALNEVDRDANRPVLKKNGLLTRDPRTRERRMVGTGGKARRQKQSPKR
ncbi:30S ribosomal protein S9 [Candidatus Roizmanbacteria bacterium]|nr:30S ribosomal protein S9 [Candidatus Roizmanbacteria bacterium]